ncbi:MAG: LytTR family transcriptional regulator, partial [Lachnospiraceae bacterium]|nr:LytTR family transcriptional regulator [Lachnospiraceae bacterium]
TLRDMMAYRGEEALRLLALPPEGNLTSFFSQVEIADLCIIDGSAKMSLEGARVVRRQYPGIRMILVVSREDSPESYIRPDIMPSALLMRPLSKKAVLERAEELLEDMRGEQAKEEDVFIVETKDGVTRIPYSRILYFESSQKKIFVRLKKEEYSYYGTLEALEEQLPEGFARCHRSFIVNARKCESYQGTDGELVLEGGLTLPVSRSYRKDIRKIIR